MTLETIANLALGTAAAAALVGSVLLVIGLRGKKVSDHLHCRRCGFDLFGLPLDSDRCSECGSDLKRPRAVREGKRLRRWGRVATATVLLVPSTPILTALLWAHVTDLDLQRHKPAWWLRHDVTVADRATQARALREVIRRMRDGTLANPDAQFFITRALAVQGGPEEAWMPAWGWLMEHADALALATPNQTAQYLARMVELTVIPPENPHLGQPLTPQAHLRVSSHVGRDRLQFEYYLTGIQVDGRETQLPDRITRKTTELFGNETLHCALPSLHPTHPAYRQLAAGEHQVSVNLVARVELRTVYGPLRSGWYPLTLHSTWRVTDEPGIPTWGPLTDEQWDGVARSLTVECSVTPWPDRKLGVFVSSRDAPADAVFDAWRVEGNRTSWLGVVVVRKGKGSRAAFFRAGWLRESERSVEVLLTPQAETSAGPVGSRSIRLRADDLRPPEKENLGVMVAMRGIRDGPAKP